MKGTFTFKYVKEMNRIRVDSDSSSLYGELMDVYTVANPQYFYLSRKGIDGVEANLSAISPTGTFRVGLFISVHKTALSLVDGDSSRIIIDGDTKSALIRECKPLNGLFGKEHEIRNIDPNRQLRDYQRDAVEKLLRYGKGICVSPTGSGKSFCIGTLISELRNEKDRIECMKNRRRFLLVVPTRQLVDQMYSDLTEYGIDDICMWTSDSGKKKDGTYRDNSCSNGFANLIITNHDWIDKELSHGNKKRNRLFPYGEIGCVIADEVHTVALGTHMFKIIEKMNPPLRFGFTGTLPTDMFKQWSIIGLFGIVVYENKIKNFQNEGYLAQLEIQPIRGVVEELEKKGGSKYLYSIHHRNKLGDILEDGTVVDTGTALKMENEFFEINCEELYSPLFDKMTELFDFKNRNMIVLFDRLSVGGTIRDMLRSKFDESVKVHYMDGSIDVSERERIRLELESSNGNVLVAQSVTASVGLNIKNLNGIAFAFSGKSYIRVIQSIGRVIRLKHDKSSSKLFELFFNTRYSNAHHLEKMSIFRENYGDDSIRKEIVVKI